MNKKFTLFFIILTIGILYIFNIEKVIQNKLSILNNSIQSTYINFFTSISNTINTYLNQLDYIKQLQVTNDSNLKYKLLYNAKKNELKDLDTNINLLKSYDTELDLKRVKVLSYYKFNDTSRVIIDQEDLNTSVIYSLLTFDGYSAGIVLNKNGTSIAYLNNNERCNYTVYIGKENAPGITSGLNSNGQLLIKYVPIWKKVSIGDEVITSSMDSIFPLGIKVGKVTKITVKDNIQEILVKPYAKTLGNRNYYLYNNPNPIISNN
jgi:rod shape-determining protein MreC